MKKLAIYARQSRAKETNGSIEDQIIKGKAKALELMKEYSTYVDRGITAMNDDFENRPAFKQMLDDIKGGKIDSVYVIDCSRLTRNTITEAVIKEIFRENNVLIYSGMEGIIDYKDSNGEFMAGLFALLNRKNVSDASAKIRSVLKNRVINGKAHGSIMKPYGYKGDENKNLVLDEEEVIIVQRIFDYSLMGMGTGKIAKKLNAENVFTKGRKVLKNGITLEDKFTKEKHVVAQEDLKWAGNTILSMLRNPLYKGERLYKEVTYPCPAIIDKSVWETVQKVLDSNRNKQGEIKHKYLLKGLCTCGRCGKNIVGRTRLSKRDHYYYCSSKIRQESCGLRSLNIDYLEEIIWYMVANSSQITEHALNEAEKLKNPKHIKTVKDEIKKRNARLAKLKPVKDKIIEAFTFDVINSKEMKERITENQNDIEELKEEIFAFENQLSGHQQLANEISSVEAFQCQLKKIKDSSSYEMKQYLIKLFIDRIFIDFDDEIETYTIRVEVNIPDLSGSLESTKEEHSFYVKKGERPNLLNYDVTQDKYYQNRRNNDDMKPFPYTIKNGKKHFTNKVKFSKTGNEGGSDDTPPSTLTLPMSHLSAEELIHSPEKFLWPIMAFFSWMNCQSLSEVFWK